MNTKIYISVGIGVSFLKCITTLNSVIVTTPERDSRHCPGAQFVATIGGLKGEGQKGHARGAYSAPQTL